MGRPTSKPCCGAAGAGYDSALCIGENLGVHAGSDEATPEFVAANWARITDSAGARPFGDAGAALRGAFAGPRGG